MQKWLRIFVVLLAVASCNSDDNSSGVNSDVNSDPNPQSVTPQSTSQPPLVCGSAIEPFDPQIFNTPGWHLFVLGDTGKANEAQLIAAQIIESYHTQYPLDAIIHTGDVFYDDGISSADDILTQTAFADIYTPLGLTDIRWFFSAGNHDYNGDIQALLQWGDAQPFIVFPELYYQTQINRNRLSFADTVNQSQGPSLNLIAIDTTPFTSGIGQAEQLAWLQQQLANDDARYTLVFGHHPIVSYGEDGNEEGLQGNVRALLKQYEVDFYLAGHEHSLQVIDVPDEPVNIVSGAGGAEITELTCDEQHLFGISQFGGVALYVTQNQVFSIPVSQRGIEGMIRH
ncbi:metallophosphoesterase [Thalassotalea litorea]|uniref:metallophosphoesterase n=1 Tax=Thalassotalea litorea TaxID=2020715 RepID=UPI001485C1FB|nr:metallophosphoesterase [Thalassotalea litorea]